jgi:O-antigen/teichoic acid export membrane protein
MRADNGPAQAGFAASLFALGSGSAAGYAFSLALAPALTRMFTPADFGLFGVVGAITAIFSIFASMSYELGIVGAQSRAEASRFATDAICIALAATAFSAPLVLAIHQLTPIGGLPAWAVAGAFVICLISVFTLVATNAAIQNNQTRTAAAGTFIGLAGRSLLLLAGGYAVGGLPGMVAGEFAGRVAGWLAVERGTAAAAVRAIRLRPRRIADHIRRNWQFAIHLTPAIAIEVCLIWLPAPLFTIVYGPAAGGFLALVQRFGSAPLTIANQSLGQLVQKHAFGRPTKGRGHFVRNLLLAAAALVPFFAAFELFLILEGGRLMSLLFGEAWRAAGFVAAAFLPLYFVQLLSIVTNRLMIVTKRTKLKLGASALHLGLMLLSFAAAKWFVLDWRGAMILQSALLTLSHLLVFVWVAAVVSWTPGETAPYAEKS